MLMCVLFFFFFKLKTAYEMRISDWSSDVCSSDLMLQIYDRVVPTRGGTTLAFLTLALLLAFATLSLLEHVRSRILVRASIGLDRRSEEHTSELQSLMRISYAVFCLKKKNKTKDKQKNKNKKSVYRDNIEQTQTKHEYEK